MKVTPKKPIFLFFVFPSILIILLVINFFLLSLLFITFLIIDEKNAEKEEKIDKSTLYLFAVLTIAFVSFGKHDPPYAGPALKNLEPIL